MDQVINQIDIHVEEHLQRINKYRTDFLKFISQEDLSVDEAKHLYYYYWRIISSGEVGNYPKFSPVKETRTFNVCFKDGN